jgi:uncharacterized protein YdaU (DUF1376 family)
MNVDLAHELLNELGLSLEHLEAQQAALMQFLKDEGIVTDNKLAPYLTQAGKASNVRWRAARVRLERLISAEEEKEERRAEKEKQQASAAQAPSQNEGNEAASKKEEGGSEAAPKSEAANVAAESAEGQPASDKKNGQDERATSEDKKAGPEQETRGK